MFKFGKRAVALMTAAAMMLGGCGAQAQKEGNAEAAGGGDADVQMGRYVEEYTRANVQMDRNGSFTWLEDGRLAVFSYNYGPYVSADEGKTWEPWQAEWYQDNAAYRSYQKAAIAPDGTIFAGYYDYSAGVEHAQDTEEANGEEEAETGDAKSDDFSMQMQYLLVHPDGSSEAIHPEWPNGNDSENWVSECWFAPDGTLYVSDPDYLYTLSPKGEMSVLLETENPAEQLCFLKDGRMLAATTQGVLIYDRESGRLTENDDVLDEFVMTQVKQNRNEIHYADDSYSVYLQSGEADQIYLVSCDGIYRHMLGGGTIEKLLEGSLSSLGDPSEGIYGMQLLSDNRFVVQYAGGSGIFSWREDIPTLPQKELKVFGLKRDVMVQQTVSLFQKEHQDVYVNYEVGLEKNSGQTKEDVIKALNTEILAGHGPDVIMLDGLPMDSYMEKGMLEDLGQVLAGAEEKETIFHNIAASLEKNGKLPAIPMRYQFPGIIGPEEVLSQGTDLDRLVAAAQKLRREKETGSVTGSIDAMATLQILATACSPAWETEDKSVDLIAVEEFLAAAGQIFAAEDAGTTEQEKESWNEVRYRNSSGTNTDDAWMMMDVAAPQAFLEDGRMGMGYISDVWSLEIMFSANRKEGMFCDVLKGQSERTFMPYTIAGVSALAKEKELAKQFVGLMLSADASSGDGFCVNRDAVEEQVRLNNDGDGGIIGAMYLQSDTGAAREMTVYQMTQEEVAWLYETLESLRTPDLIHERLYEAVLETGEKMLKEGMDMETALAEIQNKVRLSMAE